MPELRWNPLEREWVIIATERSRRPHDFKKSAETPPTKPAWVENCPFCVGHENQTPLEVDAFRDPDSAPNTPGWWVRTVPNKFPALSPEGVLTPQERDIYRTAQSVGVHEVIIETPLHNQTPATMPEEQWREAVRMYHHRLRTHAQDPRYGSLLLFRNEGRSAGASLEHPHAQLIALPFVPPVIQKHLAGIQHYQAEHGRHPVEAILEQEHREGARLVRTTRHYTAFAPYFARVPFEVWIVPNKAQAHFHEICDSERDEFADLLRWVLQRIDTVLGTSPYNFMLITAPLHQHAEVDFWWYLRLVPRLTIDAGFEIGTGVGINITAPEDSARFLRENSSEVDTSALQPR